MKILTRTLFFGLLCGGILFVVLGCEDKPNTDGVGDYFDDREITLDGTVPTRSPQGALQIMPDGEIIVGTDGEIVELSTTEPQGTVSWSVQNSTRGEIVTTSSRTATYRRNTEGDNVVTATDASGSSDSKVIKQPARVLATLAITPSGTVTLTNNLQRQTFSVTGAEGGVQWSVDLTNLGVIISPDGAKSVEYERRDSGDNVIRVRDSAGREAMKPILQP